MAFTSYRPGLTRAATLTAAALLLLLAPPAGRVTAAEATLPLGDLGLAETRTTQTLADGVTLTRIVRGTEPAPADQINTTTRGPWVVDVLTIDPRRARGQLKATYGPDLAPHREDDRPGALIAGPGRSQRLLLHLHRQRPVPR
ncbi:hypothetical protein AB0M41_46240 [Streptomyces sp. NPDC051896]|uniref:hypothetical protein n=1 Tax=Streptomyces sp. NPDC051896 TaxID=3155416 RepID=UPI0034367CF5